MRPIAAIPSIPADVPLQAYLVLAAILFCITGLVLLWMHAPRRAPTWFIVGAGLIIPALVAVFLVHV
jgi:hypothetical protein